MASGRFTEPFVLVTSEGKFLVLKAVRLCNLKTVDCNAGSASCVLKVDKPDPPCPRRASPPGSPKCEQQLQFMRTDLLSNLFNTNKTRAMNAMNNEVNA
ncbi:DNA-binding phosphoprotein [Western grey kangaroopox virus]|uniref:DNA-binding phosphoprotein n=1 Tax=Western grey kangaroopox virus TaxID=1566307 RepID=A0A2C9DSJ0_9POXV|nr:DNA-binding phosphoprotein [Western grey kangaroopox virus]ATI20973.1 DNA-binding phosphoprotein [Western grey kangaroopox virus]